MKKTLISAISACATVAFAGVAFAATENGTITSINPDWSVELDNGTFYTATDASKLEGLKAGDRVQVEYGESGDGERMVVRIKKMDGTQRN